MTPLESANSPKEKEIFDLSSECGTEKCKSKKKIYFVLFKRCKLYYQHLCNFNEIQVYFIFLKAVFFIGWIVSIKLKMHFSFWEYKFLFFMHLLGHFVFKKDVIQIFFYFYFCRLYSVILFAAINRWFQNFAFSDSELRFFFVCTLFIMFSHINLILLNINRAYCMLYLWFPFEWRLSSHFQ